MQPKLYTMKWIYVKLVKHIDGPYNTVYMSYFCSIGKLLHNDILLHEKYKRNHLKKSK